MAARLTLKKMATTLARSGITDMETIRKRFAEHKKTMRNAKRRRAYIKKILDGPQKMNIALWMFNNKGETWRERKKKITRKKRTQSKSEIYFQKKREAWEAKLNAEIQPLEEEYRHVANVFSRIRPGCMPMKEYRRTLSKIDTRITKVLNKPFPGRVRFPRTKKERKRIQARKIAKLRNSHPKGSKSHWHDDENLLLQRKRANIKKFVEWRCGFRLTPSDYGIGLSKKSNIFPESFGLAEIKFQKDEAIMLLKKCSDKRRNPIAVPLKEYKELQFGSFEQIGIALHKKGNFK